MSKTSDKVRESLQRKTGRRTIRAAEASDVIAANFKDISAALLQTDTRFTTAVEAMSEVLAFMEIVKSEVGTLAGRALEGAELAADHAHDMAHVATLVANMPDVIEAVKELEGRYTLPAGANEEMVRKVIKNLEGDLRRASGKGGVTFELLVRRNEQPA